MHWQQELPSQATMLSVVKPSQATMLSVVIYVPGDSPHWARNAAAYDPQFKFQPSLIRSSHCRNWTKGGCSFPLSSQSMPSLSSWSIIITSGWSLALMHIIMIGLLFLVHVFKFACRGLRGCPVGHRCGSYVSEKGHFSLAAVQSLQV